MPESRLRAPEVILGDRRYTNSVDVWSAACILFEMLAGVPLFDAGSEKTLIVLIMKLLGTPTRSHWRRIASLSRYPKLVSQHKQHFTRKNPVFDDCNDRHELDLFERLLQWHPQKRIDAYAILQHPYLGGVKSVHAAMFKKKK